MNKTDLLADGSSFAFWETDVNYTREIYVDAHAADGGDGSREKPFRTIQQAADIAEPGNHVLILPGEYRECVRPRKGGSGPDSMIVYEAAEKGSVIVKASEVVRDFTRSTGWILGRPFSKSDSKAAVYQHKLDPDMFRGYNPFMAINLRHNRDDFDFPMADLTPYLNRRGVVFCDGEPLKQVSLFGKLADQENAYFVEANGMTVHFRLKGDEDPKDHLIELTVREQCFAPEVPFLAYIKVKGITFTHAAMGAPIPQKGTISASRGHHWVVEDCRIEWANAMGMDFGNEDWFHEREEGRIFGYSVIRRCEILNCGVCGIAGVAAKEMLIEDNLFENTGWQRMEVSWEAGAIKLHETVNTLIRRNVFRHTYACDHIWLDCNNENNRITQNVFLDGIEQREAIFVENEKEGVNLMDNNIIWNIPGRYKEEDIPKEIGAWAWYKLREFDVVNGWGVYGEGADYLELRHNLIGKVRHAGYYAKPVAFRISPMQRGGTSRAAKIYGNIFYECQEAAINFPTEKNESQDNLFVRQQGGFLRIHYPDPEACLDLKAWKEFYGFDLNAEEGWFDIEIDSQALTLTVKRSEAVPRPFMGMSRNYQTDPAALKRMQKDSVVQNDFFGNEVEGDEVLPGPFAELYDGCVYNIDPRKLG